MRERVKILWKKVLNCLAPFLKTRLPISRVLKEPRLRDRTEGELGAQAVWRVYGQPCCSLAGEGMHWGRE